MEVEKQQLRSAAERWKLDAEDRLAAIKEKHRLAEQQRDDEVGQWSLWDRITRIHPHDLIAATVERDTELDRVEGEINDTTTLLAVCAIAPRDATRVTIPIDYAVALSKWIR